MFYNNKLLHPQTRGEVCHQHAILLITVMTNGHIYGFTRLQSARRWNIYEGILRFLGSKCDHLRQHGALTSVIYEEGVGNL